MKGVPKTPNVQKKILQWYGQHKRPLPWRATRDPYAITISEVMLQQTQVDRVIPKYHTWLKKFPNWKSLAQASKHEVLQLWSGLGYNSRAIRLRELARTVVENRGVMPRALEKLEELPGIGRYTAGAIMAFAFKKEVSFMDTNIRRVVRRIYFGTKNDVPEKKIAARAADLVPKGKADIWHHALMDLGAMVCISGRPRCEQCPVRQQCRAYPNIMSMKPRRRMAKGETFRNSDRFWRGAIVRSLLQSGPTTRQSLWQSLPKAPRLLSGRFQKLVVELQRDGLLAIIGSKVKIAST